MAASTGIGLEQLLALATEQGIEPVAVGSKGFRCRMPINANVLSTLENLLGS